MPKCCECGNEFVEDTEGAILDVPFAEELVHFCSQKCYDEGKV